MKKGKKNDLSEEDFDVIRQVLDVVPELKISALAIKRIRSAKLKYPIETPKVLQKLLEKEEVLEGHHISRNTIDLFMTKELFPINDERELASRTYLCLIRCKEAMAWAAQAPDNARDILKEYEKSIKKIGGK